MPNDSARAPMLAATQKWPSGRLGSSVAAVRPGRDSRFEQCLSLGHGRASTQPVPRAGELPRRLEVPRVLLEPLCPHGRGLASLGEILSRRVEDVGIGLWTACNRLRPDAASSDAALRASPASGCRLAPTSRR